MMLPARSVSSFCLIPQLAARAFHASAARGAITKMAMPAMSPTMTEGGLAEWKVKEGETYSQGDVLLDIETDKATMDVEAPEDGVLAKILVPNGSKDVPVGKTIALLAEEGDDLSNLEIPEDEAPAAAATPDLAPEAPKAAPAPEASPATPASGEVLHPPAGGPYLPSVSRLLAEKHITDPSKIKGTGLHGILTKGDVLAFVGEVSSPTGTFKPAEGGLASLYGGSAAPNPAKADQADTSAKSGKTRAAEPLSGDALRALIIGGLVDVTHKQAAPLAQKPEEAKPAPKLLSAKPTFEDVLAGYHL